MEQLPRPSAWNKFANDTANDTRNDSLDTTSVKNGFALRAFSMDAGLPEESKFLSHWFGLSKSGESSCEEQLPRPCAWNYFATEHNDVSQSEGAEKNRYELRQWAFDAGLPEESRFLSHWFGLASAGSETSNAALPRPSPWNQFVKEDALVDEPMEDEADEENGLEATHEELALRAFAMDAGLPEESKFLSHWFGLTKSGEEGATLEQLPRPSAWNKFVPASTSTAPAAPAVERNRYELRKWAFDAGLPDESRFLSHWFGLESAGGARETQQLPRPSAWNTFMTDTTCNINCTKSKCPFSLRGWSHEVGLQEDSQFLSHWFGLTNSKSTTITDAYGPAIRFTPWNYVNY